MPHLRLLRRRRRRLQRLACFLHLWVGCALLFSGSQSQAVELEALGNESVSAESQSCDRWVLAPHAEHLLVTEHAKVLAASETQRVPSRYWQFSDDTRLVCLPGIDEAAETDVELAIPAEPETPGADASGSPTENVASKQRRAIEDPVYPEHSPEERQLLDLIKRETLAATTGVPTDAKLDLECREKIAAAYALSQRGAAYAARQELIAVLRLISQAKDSREGTRSRTEGLAAGLRALEEAEDFSPPGSQLEADMQLEVVCAAHRTPLAREMNLATTLPAQMMERYHRYAQIKLAVAVAGEPAGSMALYSLGKLCSQLAATEAEEHPLATRGAVAFQQAALLAHNANYLAAHELGVLLAETGHYPEAQHLLSQVAAEQPNAVVLRNLARVQDELGQHGEALNSRHSAQMLAQQGRGPKPNVAWVAPQDFSRNQMNTFTPQVATRPAAPSQSAPAVVWR